MSDTAHTPTPWKVGAYGGVYPDNGKETAAIAYASTKSGFLPNYKNNEAHIVKCVNAHDGLVKALNDALAGLRYVRERYGSLSGVGFDRVDENGQAALAKARGEAM